MPPSHTPQSSNSKVEPQASSHPDGPASKHPQPRSSALSPLHIPQSSNAPTQSSIPSHVPSASSSAEQYETLSHEESADRVLPSDPVNTQSPVQKPSM